MRKPLICGNWKMNKTRAEAEQFFGDLSTRLAPAAFKATDVMIACSYTLLDYARTATVHKGIGIAAQNVHEALAGAYTGEISLPMLQDLGIKACVIGHSERRQYYHETDDKVAAKTKLCLENNVLPIVCVGESLTQREADLTFDVIRTQVNAVLAALSEPSLLVIAYEPVWAIGTGKTATKEQAQEVHSFIRSLLAEAFGAEKAQTVRILYGGSVTPANASELLRQDDIDGALVGGASLKAIDFSQIVAASIP